jgi:hypothetical protein
MNALATVVACYGLFENSPAVVIGAMIIAMLLGPIAGVSLGLIDGNNPLFRKALATLAGGVNTPWRPTEVRFRRGSGRMVVVAVFRTPVPFTPEEVGALEPRLG